VVAANYAVLDIGFQHGGAALSTDDEVVESSPFVQAARVRPRTPVAVFHFARVQVPEGIYPALAEEPAKARTFLQSESR